MPHFSAQDAAKKSVRPEPVDDQPGQNPPASLEAVGSKSPWQLCPVAIKMNTPYIF